MTYLQNFSFVGAFFYSLILHGGAIIFLISLVSKPSPQRGASFEVVWEKPMTSCPPKSNIIKKESIKIRKIIPHKLAFKKQRQVTLSQMSSAQTRSQGALNLSSSSSYAKKNKTPARLYQPLPSYPWVCRKRQQEGVVHLHVKTNEEGRVISVSLCKSSGHSLLDKAAVEAVQCWIFEESSLQKTFSIAFKLKEEKVSFS